MKKETKQLGMVMLLGCRCRCGHEWLPRQKEEKPRVCPKCKVLIGIGCYKNLL